MADQRIVADVLLVESDLHVGDGAFGVAGSDDGIMRAAEISRAADATGFMAITE